MKYFPFFADLHGRRGLIVGGGKVSLGKVRALLPFGPDLTLVAPRFLPELEALPGLTLLRREFEPRDLTGMAFAVAATDDEALNAEIAARCRELGVPVNTVDDRERCDFIFPALISRGDLTVGVSTGGASPTAAVWLRDEIEALLPEHFEEILAWLEEKRPEIKKALSLKQERAQVFSQLFTACLVKGNPLTDRELSELLAAHSAG